jgi:hypothetical protein
MCRSGTPSFLVPSFDYVRSPFLRLFPTLSRSGCVPSSLLPCSCCVLLASPRLRFLGLVVSAGALSALLLLYAGSFPPVIFLALEVCAFTFSGLRSLCMFVQPAVCLALAVHACLPLFACAPLSWCPPHILLPLLIALGVWEP